MKPQVKPKQIFRITELLNLALLNWPWIMLFIIGGAILGYGYTILKPSVYESFAVVQVDHNAEEALVDDIWKLGVRREYFLEEQTRLLEGVAISDEVLSTMLEVLQERGLPLAQESEDLFGNASLPHPSQGSWRLVFREADPEIAAQRANAWAEAFVAVVENGVVNARQLRSRRTQTVYFAGQLASQELLCVQLPDLQDQMETKLGILESLAPEADAGNLVRWWLMEITARAGYFQNAEEYALETNKDSLNYLQDVQSMVEERVSSCPQTLQSLQTALDNSIDAESGLAEAGTGLSPYLEISIRKAAVPAANELILPGRIILLGGILGLITGIFWLFIQLVQRAQTEEES